MARPGVVPACPTGRTRSHACSIPLGQHCSFTELPRRLTATLYTDTEKLTLGLDYDGGKEASALVHPIVHPATIEAAYGTPHGNGRDVARSGQVAPGVEPIPSEARIDRDDGLAGDGAWTRRRLRSG